MELNLYGNKKVEISRCLRELPEMSEILAGEYADRIEDTDFLTTKPKTTLREAQALNYALLRCLQNPKNNTLRGALIGCIAKIIDPKKHSLTKDGKALKLSVWNLLFVPAPLLRVLAGALLGFFMIEGALTYREPKQDSSSSSS